MPPISIIGNPIPDDFAVPPVWHSANRPIKRLIAVGRLDEQKGFATLLHVFSRLRDSHPDWRLKIIGEGELRGALENDIAKLNLAEYVELPGRTHDIKNELLQSDVFVLSSMYEGFPNALLEAMSVGVPCVAMDCPSGPREISEDGKVAVLVPLGDEQALHDALEMVMQDVQLRVRLANAGRESVLKRYSLGGILAQWQRVLTGK
jgi:glycosyltransferase involved in cell wall biosynthesis